MKKLFVLLMVFVLAFAVVGCGGDTSTDTNTQSEGSGATDNATSTDANTQAEEGEAEMPKIGVTIYKFDDNFMSFVRRSIEVAAEGKAELILNDSQNNQATQNDQVDMMISKGVKSLAINLVDPQAASTIISKAQSEDLPVIFFTLALSFAPTLNQ